MVTKNTGFSLLRYQPQRSRLFLNSLHSSHKSPWRNVSTAALILKFEEEPRVLNKQHGVWPAVPVWMGGKQDNLFPLAGIEPLFFSCPACSVVA
jgi:hypothetical protein